MKVGYEYEPDYIDRNCAYCDNNAIDQNRFSDDVCLVHFNYEVEWDRADNAVKWSKENDD